AQRIAHTLKGVSGSLGALELFRACQALDAALREGRSSGYDDLLSSVENALLPVLGGVEQLIRKATLQDQSRASADTLCADPEEIASLVEELTTLLDDMDPDAEDEAKRLREALSGTRQGNLAEIIEKQTADFDFDDALRTLTDLKASLNCDAWAEVS
ncbi:Hpt domain-containing protein, partial [Thermodesulfobacteriota bacterium]